MGYAIAVSIGMSFIPFIFAYLAINMDKKHEVLRNFFLVMILVFSTIDLWVFKTIATTAGEVEIAGVLSYVYMAGFYTTILFTVYIIGMFLYNLLSEMKIKKTGTRY